MIIFAFCAGIEPFKTVSPQQNMKLKLYRRVLSLPAKNYKKDHTFKA